MGFRNLCEGLIVLVFVLFLSCTNQEKKSRVVLDVIEQSEKESNSIIKINKLSNSNFARAQFYRWLTFNERPLSEVRMANHLDLLQNEVSIKSIIGETKSKQDYKESLPKNFALQSAHHLEEIEISLVKDSLMSIIARVNHQTIKTNGIKDTYAVNYHAEMICQANALPLFANIKMDLTNSDVDGFDNTYVENRCQSILYKWIGNLEQLNDDEKPFLEMLAEKFVIHLSTDINVDNPEKLKGWLKNSSAVLNSSHFEPEITNIRSVSETDYEMKVEMNWSGYTRDDREMNGKTVQIWLIKDVLDNAFPKIKQIEIEQVSPFEFVESDVESI